MTKALICEIIFHFTDSIEHTKMWKNIMINFLVLSFIIFSGEYLRHRINTPPIPDSSVKKNNQIKLNISGRWIEASHPIRISGASQPFDVRTYHICGQETHAAPFGSEMIPIGKIKPGNLLIATSS